MVNRSTRRSRTIACGAGLIAALLGACSGAGGAPDVPRRPLAFGIATLHTEPVPRTLDQALETLGRALPTSIAVQIARSRSEDVMLSFHMSLGLWIRNNWGLLDRGPLYQDLARHGLTHPDDMSAVILTSFWRQQHGRPIDVAGQVRTHREYWRSGREARRARRLRV